MIISKILIIPAPLTPALYIQPASQAVFINRQSVLPKTGLLKCYSLLPSSKNAPQFAGRPGVPPQGKSSERNGITAPLHRNRKPFADPVISFTLRIALNFLGTGKSPEVQSLFTSPPSMTSESESTLYDPKAVPLILPP